MHIESRRMNGIIKRDADEMPTTSDEPYLSSEKQTGNSLSEELTTWVRTWFRKLAESVKL